MMGAFIVKQEFSLGINSQNHHWKVEHLWLLSMEETVG
jgi:hypothetical protein